MNAELLGRDEELTQLHELLDANRGGLLLLVGRPHVGKQQLLRYLWRQLGARGRHLLLPSTADEEFLRIDPRTEIEAFEQAVHADAEGHTVGFSGGRVIGIYGYQPSTAFADWFTGRYLPGLAKSGARRGSLRQSAVGRLEQPGVATTVVLAGFARDVEGLRSHAAAQPIVLQPLSVDIVKQHLVAKTAGLVEALSPAELDAYAQLVHDDAGVLNPLLRVLALDETRRTE